MDFKVELTAFSPQQSFPFSSAKYSKQFALGPSGLDISCKSAAAFSFSCPGTYCVFFEFVL